MLYELKTLHAICDNCGYDQQFTSAKHEYPSDWGKATRSQYVGTRMENEKDALCPDCVHAMVKHGYKKYSLSTLHIF